MVHKRWVIGSKRNCIPMFFKSNTISKLYGAFSSNKKSVSYFNRCPDTKCANTERIGEPMKNGPTERPGMISIVILLK